MSINDQTKLEREYRKSVRVGLKVLFDDIETLKKFPERDKTEAYMGLSNLALQCATQSLRMGFCPIHFLETLQKYVAEERKNLNKDGGVLQ